MLAIEWWAQPLGQPDIFTRSGRANSAYFASGPLKPSLMALPSPFAEAIPNRQVSAQRGRCKDHRARLRAPTADRCSDRLRYVTARPRTGAPLWRVDARVLRLDHQVLRAHELRESRRSCVRS